jgi:hypothetical protein
VVCGQAPRQLAGERQQPLRLQEQRIEIEPEITVVAGLQPEMALACGQEIEKLGFHTTVNPEIFGACRLNYTPLIWSPAW